MRNQLIVISFFFHISSYLSFTYVFLTDNIDASCQLNGSFPALPKQTVCLHQCFVQIHSVTTCRLSLGRPSLSRSAATVQDACFRSLSPAFVSLAQENLFFLTHTHHLFFFWSHHCSFEACLHTAIHGERVKCAHTLCPGVIAFIVFYLFAFNFLCIKQCNS